MNSDFSFRFLEFPEPLESLFGLAGKISLIYGIWKKRFLIQSFFSTVIESASSLVWLLIFLSFPVFNEISEILIRIKLQKQAKIFKSLSILVLTKGSYKLGISEEIFFGSVFSTLANKDTPEESKSMAVISLSMFIFAKALENNSQNNQRFRIGN